MRDGDKPFVMYRRGPANFTIVPRGLLGWAQFALWLALLAPLLMWFVDLLGLNLSRLEFAESLLLLGAGVVAWLVAGLWWMIAHAQVIDPVALERDRLRERRKRERESADEQGSQT